MRKLLGLFGEKVKTVVCRKIAATVSRENYRLCAAIANFIVTYSD